MRAGPVALQRRILTASEAVAAVRGVQRAQQQRDEWPYAWCYPPPGAIRVKQANSIPAPAPTVQALVLAYTVPAGFWFALTRIVQTFQASGGVPPGGYVPGRGDATWTLDKNVPLGYPLLQGSVIQGFGADTVPLGSFVIPWSLDVPEILMAGDTVRSKVLTTNAILQGDPNYFSSLFLGWLVPAE